MEEVNDQIVKYLLNKSAEYVATSNLKEAVASYEAMVMMLLRENLMLRKQEIDKDLVSNTSQFVKREKKKSMLGEENALEI